MLGLGFDAGVALGVWLGAPAVLPEHPVVRESFLQEGAELQ